MRIYLWALALSLTVVGSASLPARAQSPADPMTARCPGSTTTGPDVEEIRRLELRGGQVNVEGWSIEEARGFFAPDFFAIEPGGQINRLDKILSGFSNGRNPGFARSFDISGLDIRVYGCDAAVVTGLADVRVLAAPPDAPAWRIRFLNVWRRDEGRWRLAANQFVRVMPAPNSPAPSTPQR